ncbi:MAG: hypothetical protein V9E88_17460 [Ferruginibacter sp.]
MVISRTSCLVLQNQLMSHQQQVAPEFFLKIRASAFYTYRDYIEITEGFKGTLSLPLLGAERNSLYKWLGLPKMKDNAWEAYQVRHGILVVYFDNNGKINKLQISSKTAETLQVVRITYTIKLYYQQPVFSGRG